MRPGEWFFFCLFMYLGLGGAVGLWFALTTQEWVAAAFVFPIAALCFFMATAVWREGHE